MLRSGILLVAILAVQCQAAQRKDGACEEIHLLRAAMSQLPEQLRFPCDAEHVTVIRDVRSFLNEHPDIAADPELRRKAEHAMAFTVRASWPLYINLTSHRALPDAYDRGLSWVACVFAAVLAHERVHAMGNASEAAGLAAELALDKSFRAEGKLPAAAFDLAGLEKQWREALEAERRVGAR